MRRNQAERLARWLAGYNGGPFCVVIDGPGRYDVLAPQINMERTVAGGGIALRAGGPIIATYWADGSVSVPY